MNINYLHNALLDKFERLISLKSFQKLLGSLVALKPILLYDENYLKHLSNLFKQKSIMLISKSIENIINNNINNFMYIPNKSYTLYYCDASQEKAAIAYDDKYYSYLFNHTLKSSYDNELEAIHSTIEYIYTLKAKNKSIILNDNRAILTDIIYYKYNTTNTKNINLMSLLNSLVKDQSIILYWIPTHHNLADQYT